MSGLCKLPVQTLQRIGKALVTVPDSHDAKIRRALKNRKVSRKAWNKAETFSEVLAMSKLHISDPCRYPYVPYDLGMDHPGLASWKEDLLSLHQYGILPENIGEWNPDSRTLKEGLFESISFVMADVRQKSSCRSLRDFLKKDIRLIVEAFRRGREDEETYLRDVFGCDHFQSPAMQNQDLWCFQVAIASSQSRFRDGPPVNMARVVLEAIQAII